MTVTVGVASAAGAGPSTAAAPGGASQAFLAGAAEADITPPPWSTASDAAFVPACGSSPDQVGALWPGKRLYEFEKPYVDQAGTGRFVPGDPYCDADHTGRYEAPYLAGGSGANRWPTSTDPANPLGAQAVVSALGATKVALVVVDSIGLFNVTMDRIRAAVRSLAPDVSQVFVSSTHDESAPDPIGLWGPEPPGNPLPTSSSSGVDEYYLDFMARRTAQAVADADVRLAPAQLRLAVGRIPSNVQSCWSSYPFIDDQALPVMQAVATATGRPIFTLVNVNTHAETLAFSGVPSYVEEVSADWPGQLRAGLAAAWPGSVGIELAGLVGSVETPTVYEPESAQVLDVPGPEHDTPNPNGCHTVYGDPGPGTAAPVTDAQPYLHAYGQSLADDAIAVLSGHATVVKPATLAARSQSVCIQLENNFFAAAFAAGLFPDRPAYADPTCTVSTSPAPSPPGSPRPPSATWVKSDVGVVTLGPAQLVYSPGEVFPFTETSGHIGRQDLPFPTDCYDPNTDDYQCGAPLPDTPWISAHMTQPFRFQAGLGQDMIGYLFPPGNFVGDDGEVAEQPWVGYHSNHPGDHDRFGHGHADDSESVGPYAGLAVTQALDRLLGNGQAAGASATRPGLFVDGAGHRSTSPFAGAGFGGAAGVVVQQPDGTLRQYVVGRNALAWVRFDATRDPGTVTASGSLPYSVGTAGVLTTGGAVLVDVFAGADAIHQ
ncbi:MAG TPA: hypothetical protein VKI64_08275 [Acidimicrobiales bacterium]|nr:hypothetical protein [Acidimicrobiales bacterium]